MVSHRKRASNEDLLLADFVGFRLSPENNSRLILDFFAALDTPVSLACYMLYEAKEFKQLVEKSIKVADYTDLSPGQFQKDFAAISFLRKHAGLPTGIDRSAEAALTFQSGELGCKGVNQKLRHLSGTKCPNEDALSRVIRKIDKILGDFDIDSVLDLCAWGPGVTLLVKGDDTSGIRKFDVEHNITRDADALFGTVFAQYGQSVDWSAWAQPDFSVGNTIVTVPKNAKTDRTIAIEPGLNAWIQSGIGRLIRRRLRFAGYDLNSDSKNQYGAYLGSVGRPLATVDFKAASDSISIEAVRLLLPPKWFTILDAARSQWYRIAKGRYHRSHKFSTMGNGFTFELESLIFLCCALAICDSMGVDSSHVAIFGDDVVLPSICVPEFDLLCEFLGFKINRDKTYAEGPFRESCGSYYFGGSDVKPLFLKADLSTTKSIYRFCNQLRLLSSRICDEMVRKRLRALWNRALHLLAKKTRVFGPPSLGDAVIHRNSGECTLVPHPSGWEGFVFPGFPDVAVTRETDSHGVLLQRLRTTSGDMSYGNSYSLRGRTRTVLKKRMFAPQWSDLDCW